MGEMAEFWRDIVGSLTAPNAKQKEAYCRFAHTLAAAAVIGAFTAAWTNATWTTDHIWRIIGLALLALLLFLAGALVVRAGEAN